MTMFCNIYGDECESKVFSVLLLEVVVFHITIKYFNPDTRKYHFAMTILV